MTNVNLRKENVYVFYKVDKQTTDFLFKGQEDSYANFKNL